MTCAQAHRLLAAYRRDDWLPAELDALGQHLAGCAECRRMEAAYRESGEHIRQLPTITPPDSFRAAVFAAIRAEDARLGRDRDIERVASDDTQPSLPVLRPTPIRTWSPRGAVLGARGAIAVAAVLLLGVSVAHFAPAVAGGVPRLAENLAGALAIGQAAGPRIAAYQVTPASARVTSAMAGPHWLAYVERDGQGRSVVYARERGTTNTFALPGARADGALTLRAVTDGWVIWQSGTGQASSAWALWASPLSPSGAAVALSDSNSASVLSGVWAGGNVALATYASPGAGSVLARFDLAPGRGVTAPSIIARAQDPSHLLADPSLDAGTYYWSEVWADGAGLHGDLWGLASGAAAAALTTSGTAFAPRATGHTLVWVQTSGPALLSQSAQAALAGQPVAAAQQALSQVGGALRARDLASGAERQLAAHAAAGSVAVAGSLVLWRDGAQTHTYDLAHHAPSQVDAAVRTASYASANAGSLTWGEAGSATINIYDGR